jgi:hypothetical protein
LDREAKKMPLWAAAAALAVCLAGGIYLWARRGHLAGGILLVLAGAAFALYIAAAVLFVKAID